MDIDIDMQDCVFHSGSILGGVVGSLFLNQCGITQTYTIAAGASMEDTQSLGTLTPGNYTITLQFTDPNTTTVSHDISVQ
jgi:VCBS repeat-containing protein